MTDKEQKMIFSENLNRYIKRSGKQQKEIAADIDVAPTTFGNWCTGLAMPKYGTIRKLAEYFNCNVSDLSDKPTPNSSKFDGISYAETQKALALYQLYKQANPQIQSAVEVLLKPVQPDT